MATVTLELPEETRQRLENKAAQRGQPLEAYIRGVLEADADRPGTPAGTADEAPPGEISVEEFERRLDELNEGLPPLQDLPVNYDREDIYFDHD